MSVETLRICPTGVKETVTETETGAHSLLGSEDEVSAKESFRASTLGRTIGCRFFVVEPRNVCTRAPTEPLRSHVTFAGILRLRNLGYGTINLLLDPKRDRFSLTRLAIRYGYGMEFSVDENNQDVRDNDRARRPPYVI